MNMKCWEQFLTYYANWSSGAVLLRLLTAFCVGAIIGLDRGIKRRGAGIKTHTLVCLGAALIMLVGQFIYVNTGGSCDIGRLPAQVISGIGFLGVGTILVTGHNQVRGLTTAASLWICACLGLAAGIGFMEGVLFGLALVMVTLKILSKVDEKISEHAKVVDVAIEFVQDSGVTRFLRQMEEQNIKTSNLELKKNALEPEGQMISVTLELGKEQHKTETLEKIRKEEYVCYLEEL